MSTRRLGYSAVAAAAVSVLLYSGEGRAAPKEECVEAHGRGQDQRRTGQLTRARQAFLSCAQSSCPALIQGDCARFGEELDRLLPSVSFSARDGKATDLPNTSVYVDEVLVATRLDDGKSYEFDPGKHIVRFVHDTKETTLRVILNQGEKGRVLATAFVDPSAPAPDSPPAAPRPSRPVFPLVVAGIGAAALVTGSVLFAVGLNKVPANCSLSTRDCSAAPGDAAFNDARSAVSLANLGAGVGIGGAAVLVTGLVWYFTQPATLATPETGALRVLQPWVGRSSGGVSVMSTF